MTRPRHNGFNDNADRNLIATVAISLYVHFEISLFNFFEPAFGYNESVHSGIQFLKTERPFRARSGGTVAPVCSAMIVTLAPATLAPLSSVTVPVTDPVIFCAFTGRRE